MSQIQACLILFLAVILLTEGCDRDRRGTGSGPDLHWAALTGDELLAKRLIAEGADVNKYDSHGRTTPLGVACEQKHMRIIELLLERGADVNKGAPLYCAANQGHFDIVKLLLDKGADPNRYRVEGIPSPVLAAVRRGNVEVLKLLVARGAEVPEVRGDGNLIREAAVLGRKDMVELLLSYGHDCDRKDSDGCTPLWLAARGGFENVVEILAAKGADVNAHDNKGRSAAGIAAEGGHAAAADLLRRLATKEAE